MTSMPFAITALYAGLLGVMIVITSVLVTMARVKHKVDFGDGGNIAVTQRVRVQGNLIEYVPIALILLGIIEAAGSASWLLHTLGVVLILARLSHAWGIYSNPKPGAGRGVGATATWLVILVAGVLAIGASRGMVVM